MKISRRQPLFTKKRIVITAIVVAALLVLGAAYWWFFVHKSAPQAGNNPRPTNSVDYGPPTTQDKQDSAAAKQNAVNNANNQNNQPQQSTPQTNANISVLINRAGQSGAGQTVSVRTQISGITSGSCDMVFTKSGQPTLTKTFQISTSGSLVACNGDIAASDFSASGDWQLSVTAKNGTSISPAATQTVTVNK